MITASDLWETFVHAPLSTQDGQRAVHHLTNEVFGLLNVRTRIRVLYPVIPQLIRRIWRNIPINIYLA